MQSINVYNLYHCNSSLTTIAVTTNKALLNEDSHTVDHTVLNNLDQLYGQHVIAQMTKKPG